jgi:hypothetical protein
MLKPTPLPPVERLHQMFRLEGGVLFWKIRPSQRIKEGARAGSRNRNGYWQVEIKGKQYKAHRLIWAMVHGRDPGAMEIDHIDMDRSNNHPTNLRLVTKQQNARNSGLDANNTSGHRGVSWMPRINRWMAYGTASGKRVYLGCFAEKTDAIAARQAWEAQCWEVA